MIPTSLSEKENYVFKTELANYVYMNSPLRKSSISPERLSEIVESFCIRNNCKCLEINTHTPNLTYIEIDAEETLELHNNWSKSFSELGYEVPLLIGQ